MTECINVYRATQSIAHAVVRCPSVRLFVTLMYRNGQTYYQTVKFRRGHPQQGRQIEVGYQKFAIFNQYFRNTDTDTEYRGISKYRYRIPNRHEKIPTNIPNTDTDSKYRYRPSSSLHQDTCRQEICIRTSNLYPDM